jgi:signal transduction histidine kinase
MTAHRDGLTRPAWQRYGIAVLLTLLVIAGRLALDPWWGHLHNRHLVFLPTVMLAAWLGGFRPGVVSSLLSTIGLYVFWSDGMGSLHAPSADLVLFLMISVAVCGLIGSLQRARASADAAIQSRERVLEVVAHDLRSPLAAIKTNADSMGRAAPDLKPRVDRVNRAVARMDDLIRDLVDTTQIEHGTLTVTTQPEAVQPIVQESVDLFLVLAQEKGVALEAPGPPVEAVVPCDRRRVLQVLSNLLGNALKFTPPGGRVTLAVAQVPGGVRVGVADTGTGIREEDLPHVFEQYWKGDQKGTGLGLFIARSIVQAHGGRIWVESPPGAGASFFFTLPCAAAAA